jgi:hypothetical protein
MSKSKKTHMPVVTKFNIKPERGRRGYYRVIVFKSRPDMLKWWRVHGDPNMRFFQFEALTFSYEAKRKHKGRWKKLDRIGDIIFYKGGFGSGVVSHEMAHAAIYHARTQKWKFKFNGGGEDWHREHEKYAYIVGSLAHQFWDKYQKTTGKRIIIKEQY